MFHRISESCLAGRAHDANPEILGALVGAASVIVVVVVAWALIG